jgi:hypothetical protein
MCSSLITLLFPTSQLFNKIFCRQNQYSFRHTIQGYERSGIMKAKKLLILVLATLFVFSLISSPAWARSPQNYRWEGVAIGIGAAILGSALLNNLNTHAYSYPEPVYTYSPPPPPRSSGHWEMRSVWVPPTEKSVWNPAHYTRDGRWVRGSWMTVVDRPGYWTKERVWIARR